MAGRQDEQEDGGRGARRTGPRDLLRRALVDDADPRFPWWLPLPGVAVAAGWAAYQALAATGGGAAGFLSALLWPGAAIFALATLTVFLGWQLDID